mgnify:CR=1 FL=1
MDLQLTNKVAGYGLGRRASVSPLAAGLAAEGAKVIINGRSEKHALTKRDRNDSAKTSPSQVLRHARAI